MTDVEVNSRPSSRVGSGYELLVKIATGGTATVYVGRKDGKGSAPLVAIKRAHPHLREDPTARAALVREATLASQVSHPNVVPILDVDQTEEELLLVMSYIEGGALSELLEKGAAPPPPIALRILLDACAGLEAVHALTDASGRDVGMVHRDISPQNILVGLDGHARLTDFGLARLTEVSSSATATVKGKIAYMAPEYIEGQPPTRQCDVFSMGVVVWECLAGRRLFRGANDADTLRRVVSQPVPRISTVSALPEPFDAVLARALSKDHLLRYRSIKALSEALSDVASLVGVAAPADVGALVQRRVGAQVTRRRETVRMMIDPEHATGSMLLDELPFEVKSGPPSSPRRSSVPPSPRRSSVPPSSRRSSVSPARNGEERTLPLDGVEGEMGAAVFDESEAETIRKPNQRVSAPVAVPRSDPTPDVLGDDLLLVERQPHPHQQWIFIAPPLLAAIVVAAILWSRGGTPAAAPVPAGSTMAPVTAERAAETTTTRVSAPTPPLASAPAPSTAQTSSAPPSRHPPLSRPTPSPPKPALPDNPYKNRVQ